MKQHKKYGPKLLIFTEMASQCYPQATPRLGPKQGTGGQKNFLFYYGPDR